ncbi:hypothetical protein QBC37DRAFT_370460 [Rhypophila decipiens]|uniref:Uncharacterized protein n=1 Tax=Rhypophila decipiens TaxID=261697 RepID=A0AAN6YFB1_9PEZI|nr:hypothetical protein QBC37DRAFT_370460 [Rhypophila decipiens]
MNAIKIQAFMERAKADAEAHKNRPEEFYWPNVRKWLSRRKGDQPFQPAQSAARYSSAGAG